MCSTRKTCNLCREHIRVCVWRWSGCKVESLKWKLIFEHISRISTVSYGIICIYANTFRALFSRQSCATLTHSIHLFPRHRRSPAFCCVFPFSVFLSFDCEHNTLRPLFYDSIFYLRFAPANAWNSSKVLRFCARPPSAPRSRKQSRLVPYLLEHFYIISAA